MSLNQIELDKKIGALTMGACCVATALVCLACSYPLFDSLLAQRKANIIVKVKDSQVDYSGDDVQIWFDHFSQTKSVWAGFSQVLNKNIGDEICVGVIESGLSKKVSYSFLKTGKCL